MLRQVYKYEIIIKENIIIISRNFQNIAIIRKKTMKFVWCSGGDGYCIQRGTFDGVKNNNTGKMVKSLYIKVKKTCFRLFIFL